MEDIAHLFRQYFRLSTPVMPQLSNLLRMMEIEWISDANLPDKIEAAFVFNERSDKWEIQTGYNVGSKMSLCILHELFEILFWRCYYLIPWWKEWMERANVKHPHPKADDFACAVILPSQTFIEKRAEYGFNIWTLAPHFQTSPGTCFRTIARYRLDFPYFHAWLYFVSPQKLSQTVLHFSEESVLAKIWRKAGKYAFGHSLRQWPEMDKLIQTFPSQNRLIEADAILCRAMRTHRAIMEQTDYIAGIRLPKPVCLVARPNNYDQMFVHIVPCDHEEYIMDDTLRMQRQAAAALALEDSYKTDACLQKTESDNMR